MTQCRVVPRRTRRTQIASIRGIGTAVPAVSVAQTEALRWTLDRCSRSQSQAHWVTRVFENSGIERRGSILGAATATGDSPGAADFFALPRDQDDRGPGTAARMAKFAELGPALALQAARGALAEAGIEPAAITHLLTISCTGFGAPGWDMRLRTGLGLSAAVSRLNIGFMGCHAAFNSLAAARKIVAGDRRACVLLICLELCSLHFAYGFDPQRIVANALFADGATAAVIAPVRRGARTAGDRGRWNLLDTASLLLPDSEEAMTWRIGDHGFAMTLAPSVPELVGAHLPGFLRPWLARHGLLITDVANWAMHPGGPKVLSAAAEALGLDPAAVGMSRRVLAEHGNMSSGTILFILDRLAGQKAAGPTVALGFGPGLTLEAMLLD
jgi:predicted naringenin-chalcone synthase